MSELPDELWRKILEMGVQKSKTNNTNLSFKDLCCLSISCKRLRCISNEDSLWSSLLAYDFPRKRIIISSPSTKTLYKSWHEKDKARRLAAHRRAVLRKESHIAEHSERLEELRTRRDDETAKMKIAAVELSNLRKVRKKNLMPRGLLKAEIRPGGGDFRPSDGDQLWLVHVAAASGLFT